MDGLDLNNAKIFFSASFAFTGIIVFYVAALISGNNIYRDLEFQYSSMLSVAIGTILFLLVPIGYVVSIPSLFDSDLKQKLANLTQKLVDLTKEQEQELTEQIIHQTHHQIQVENIISIHKTLLTEALLPFLLISTGLGIIFGSAAILKSRREIIYALKKYTGVSFCVITYDFAWDNFVMMLKKHARLAVELGNDSWVKGYLDRVSIKKEPKQLILCGYQIAPENIKGLKLQEWLDDEELEPASIPFTGEMLITEEDKIKKIVIHKNALKKHSHVLSHTTQASYCSLLALGFLLVFVGLCLSDDLIRDNSNLNFLHPFYFYTSLFFCFLSLISVLIGEQLLKIDYPNLNVAMILNRFITSSFAILVFAIILLEAHFFGKTLSNHLVVLQVLLGGGLLLCLHAYFLYLKPGEEIKAEFGKLYFSLDDKHKELLKRILTYLCDEMDLNNSSQKDEYDGLKEHFEIGRIKKIGMELFAHKTFVDEEAINKLFNGSANFKGLNKFIEETNKQLLDNKDAQLNIVIKLEKYCTLWG
ncbi:MAG: hypothetical protein PHN45_03270 [Methylococcales bacterium]|nr:hypothetical protein [Methylococcales bacterium]